VHPSRAGAELDIALREQVAHRGSRDVAEDPEWLAFGGDKCDRCLGRGTKSRTRHDRQLVRGQRPRGRARHDHDDLPTMPARGLAEDPLDRRHVRGAGEHERPRERRLRRRPDRDQQVVIRACLPGREVGRPSVHVHRGQLAGYERDGVAPAQVVEVERRGRGEAERRGDGRLAMLEGVRRGQQLDLEAAAGHVTKRQDRLDGRNPGAGDEDSMRHSHSVRPDAHRRIRARP
jgi:hypothetical protein